MRRLTVEYVIAVAALLVAVVALVMALKAHSEMDRYLREVAVPHEELTRDALRIAMECEEKLALIVRPPLSFVDEPPEAIKAFEDRIWKRDPESDARLREGLPPVERTTSRKQPEVRNVKENP